jgi:hypothetical protein
VDEATRRALQHQIDEQRQAADWRDAFSNKQQDKARFFITLVTSETFAIGLSLNTMPPQRWLWAPSAITFLICFAACFWSIYHFAWVIAPREFRAVDEGKKTGEHSDEEEMMRATKENTERQNKRLDGIVDEQGLHLQRGVKSFFAFNVIFAVALFVSRLSWFFPPD